MKLSEGLSHSNYIRVDKYSPDQVKHAVDKFGFEPAGQQLATLFTAPELGVFEDFTPNLITTGGLGRLTNFLIGAGSLVGFSGTTTTMIGVGDTTTAAAAADTQLGSNSVGHSYYVAADSTPTRTTTTVTNDTVQAVATFNTSNSDFIWNEWGFVLVTTAAASATFAGTGTSPLLFNHKIASVGTKSGGSWVFTSKVTFS